MSYHDEGFRIRDEADMLQTILMVSAYTSFFCSSILVLNILIDWKTKLSHIYQRLLLGLSLCDMIASLNISQINWVANHHGSCVASGLLVNFFVVVAMYNAMLCLHFMLIICYQWTPTKFKQNRWLEWSMHLVAVGWPLSFSFVGAIVGAYGEISFIPGMCSWDQFPDGRCDSCVEVPEAFWLGFGGMALPGLFAFLTILFTLFRIFWHVLQQERKQLKYQFNTGTDDTTNCYAHGDTTSTPQRQRRFSLSIRPIRRSLSSIASQTSLQKRRFFKCKESGKQAGLFILAYLVTIVPYSVGTCILAFSPNPYRTRVDLFQLACVITFFGPLQGLWNLIIYARPRFHNLKHRHPEKHCIILLGMAIWQRSNKPSKQRTTTKTGKRKKKKNNENANQLDDFSRMMSQPLDTRIHADSPSSNDDGSGEVKEEEKREENTSDYDGIPLYQIPQRQFDQLSDIVDEDDVSIDPFDENFELIDEEATEEHHSGEFSVHEDAP